MASEHVCFSGQPEVPEGLPKCAFDPERNWRVVDMLSARLV